MENATRHAKQLLDATKAKAGKLLDDVLGSPDGSEQTPAQAAAPDPAQTAAAAKTPAAAPDPVPAADPAKASKAAEDPAKDKATESESRPAKKSILDLTKVKLTKLFNKDVKGHDDMPVAKAFLNAVEASGVKVDLTAAREKLESLKVEASFMTSKASAAFVGKLKELSTMKGDLIAKTAAIKGLVDMVKNGFVKDIPGRKDDVSISQTERNAAMAFAAGM